MSDNLPFKRDEFIDKPGIVGARWWHEGLVHADAVSRRTAIAALFVAGGVLATGILLVKAAAAPTPDPYAPSSRKSLEMQKDYGWNFGATTESLTFDGVQLQAYQPDLVPQLSHDLTPAQTKLRPFFIPTLFQAPTATPRLALPESDPFVPLTTALRPIFTDAMAIAYRRGKAFASLFDANADGVAVIVDLVGPSSIAFAAGAASVFDPVFAIDNWPHPRGVVAAHQTLAAALYYQPLFAKAATTRGSTYAPAMFVLDRNRLTPYTDESTQFDNRHVARLPTAEKMNELGIRHLLYVTPQDMDVRELDDLNDDFVHDASAGIDVKILGADAFRPETASEFASHEPDPPYYYGGHASTHRAFWVDYPWVTPARTGAHPADVSPLGKDYVPHPRKTFFSGGTATSSTSFGAVPVMVVVATGAIVGAKFSRSGSWNRSYGSSGGG